MPAGLFLSSAGAITGTPAAAGSFPFTVTATDSSTGAGHYTGSRSVTLSVAKGTATVTLGGLAQIYTGSPLSVTATTAPAGLNVDITYNGGSTPPTNPGSYAVTATISGANYTGSATGTLVICSREHLPI